MRIAQIALSSTQEDFTKLVESLASGTSAQINPSDIYVSTDINTDTMSRYAAIENAQQGMNLTQVADGVLSDINNSLSKIMELSTKAANDIYSDAQRGAMQAEIDQLTEQINKTLSGTKYNGKDIVNVVDEKNSNKSPTIDFQVGTGSSSNSVVSYDPNIALKEMKFDVTSAEAARNSMSDVEDMMKLISTKRAEISVVQTQLLESVEYNTTAIINNQSSYSNITDTDYASAMVNLVSNQLTQETLVAVLGSALKSQSSVLGLISGISA